LPHTARYRDSPFVDSGFGHGHLPGRSESAFSPRPKALRILRRRHRLAADPLDIRAGLRWHSYGTGATHAGDLLQSETSHSFRGSMTRTGRSSRVRGLTLAAVLALAPRAAGQAPSIRTLGDIRWDTSTGSVLLQRVADNRLVVQVRILTESGSSAGRHRTRAVPTNEMEAWVLLADGTALEQTPRQPPKGAPPAGVGNAGDVYAFVSFGFKSSSRSEVVAVVVRIESQFHLFPVHSVHGPTRLKDTK
jgi:hypothetical protein